MATVKLSENVTKILCDLASQVVTDAVTSVMKKIAGEQNTAKIETDNPDAIVVTMRFR